MFLDEVTIMERLSKSARDLFDVGRPLECIVLHPCHYQEVASNLHFRRSLRPPGVGYLWGMSVYVNQYIPADPGFYIGGIKEKEELP